MTNTETDQDPRLLNLLRALHEAGEHRVTLEDVQSWHPRDRIEAWGWAMGTVRWRAGQHRDRAEVPPRPGCLGGA